MVAAFTRHALLEVVACFGIFVDAPRSARHGADIDSLMYMIYAIVGVFFVVLEGYLVFSMIRYRQKVGVKAKYETGETFREMRWILVLAVIVTVLDFAIDIKGARVWAKVKENLPAGEVKIRVIAQQFAWTFVYPGSDGRFNTADDLIVPRVLHVPANRKIRVTLTSKDVVHSFFLPEVRLKQDIMPGREIDAWFEVTKPGTYTLVCAELCGLGHTRMSGQLMVHDQADYDRWLQETAKELLP